MKAVVVGAGTMGHGIAQVAAMAGLSVTLTDADAGAVARSVERIAANLAEGVRRNKMTDAAASEALVRIHATPQAAHALADADIVIEAVVEDLEVKRRLFADFDETARADAILATNTSSLSVAAIAGATSQPGRVIGMHFFNPVHLMGLVEIVTHPQADAAVVERARGLAVKMGKTPIVVRDSPGFASSRLGIALGLEAMRMVEEGVASPEDIDTAMTLGYGHPMGPLKVTDLVGLDVRLRIAEYLSHALDDRRFDPPEILRRKVRDGELGKKTGKGFYDWPN
jgi:3-hydroxybutyryl-CoA dehydrogenase